MPGVSGPGHSPPTPHGLTIRQAVSDPAVDQSAAGKPLGAPSLCSVCASHTVTVPLGGRVGHGVHRVYAGRLHTAVGNRHLWVLQEKNEDLCELVCLTTGQKL